MPDVDLAKVDPCPNCGKPTRRMGGVPIGGSGLDLVFSGPWWCDDCLRAKCNAAADAVRSGREVQPSNAPDQSDSLGALRGDTLITAATERDQTEEDERL